jgi:hypothetical protein
MARNRSAFFIATIIKNLSEDIRGDQKEPGVSPLWCYFLMEELSKAVILT